jgi:hypothetical protein
MAPFISVAAIVSSTLCNQMGSARAFKTGGWGFIACSRRGWHIYVGSYDRSLHAINLALEVALPNNRANCLVARGWQRQDNLFQIDGLQIYAWRPMQKSGNSALPNQ